MKTPGKSKFVYVVLAFLVLSFVLQLASNTGIFLGAAPLNEWKSCQKIGPLVGLEDMVETPVENLLIGAADYRVPMFQKSGALYLIDLRGAEPSFSPLQTDYLGKLHPHGLEIYADERGMYLFVVNHALTESTIEEFYTTYEDLLLGHFRHVRTWRNPLLINPNDIVVLDPENLVVSLDHGTKNEFLKKLEDYSMMGQGSLVHLRPDGIETLASGFSYANGLAYDREKQQLYMAEMLKRRIHVFDVRPNEKNWALSHKRSIQVPAFPDNVVLQKDGHLLVGAHSNIFALQKHSKNPSLRSPSMVLDIKRGLEGDPAYKIIYSTKGQELSGISVGLLQHKHLILGSIFDNFALLCRQ